MENKKLTKTQMEKRMANALVFVPRDKEYDSFYFSDKGLRLEVTSDTAVISTGYHRHVFDSYTISGVSRPYLYVKRLIEIAHENDCSATDANGTMGYSYGKLLDVLKNDPDKQGDYIVVYYVDMWLHCIFADLYSIGETEGSAFCTYLAFVSAIARQSVLLAERNEDLTNKDFIAQYVKNIKDFTKDIEERVIYPKKTDEQIMQENIDAEQALESENVVPVTKEIEDESKD